MKTKISSHWPLTAFSSLSALANLALPLVLVRVLTTEAMGQYKAFFLYLGLMPWLSMSAGVNNGLYHWAGISKNESTAYFRMSWTLLLGWAAAISSALGLFGFLVGGFGVAPVLFVLGAFLVLVAGFHEESLVASGRTWRGAFFAAFFDILRTALVLAAAIGTRSLERVIAAYVLGLAIKALFGIHFGRQLGYQRVVFDFERKRAEWREILRYSVPVSVASLMAVVTHYADQLVLAQLATASYFASYSLGCLTVPPLNSFEQAVNRVMIPPLGSANRDGATALFREAVAELCWILIPASAGLFIFSDPIVRLLFTDRYASVGIFLRLYSFNYLLLAFPYDAYARAKGDSRWIFSNLLKALLFALLIIPVLSYRFAGIGALTGLLATQLLLRIGGFRYLQKRSGGSAFDFLPLSDIFYDTVVVLALSLACWASRGALGGGLGWFLIAGPLFTSAYFALTLRRRFRRHLLSRERPAMVHLTQYLEMGGLERVIASLVSGSSAEGGARPFDTFVFSYDERENARSLRAEFERMGARVGAVRKGRGFSVRALLSLIRLCHREKIGLIHSHDLGPLIYAVAAKLLTLGSLKLVHTQHSFVHLAKKRRYRFYERFFTRWVDRLAVVSEEGRDQYVALGVPQGRIRWIANGVEFPRGVFASSNEKSEARKRLSAQVPALSPHADRIWMLYLARIHPQKGQTHALDLWGRLPVELRNRAILILVGQESFPGEAEKLRRQCAAFSDSVVFAGATDEPMSWLETSDALVSLSEFEGMPLSPIEAYGAGLPLILSRIPGHKILSAAEDVEWIDLPLSLPQAGLANAVEKAIADPYAMRQRRFDLRGPWRENFSIRSMCDQYRRLYEETRL
jgi:glycosyltransferase involved in cell wall biosynthesis/O-antigen/teichoic acid export membrane protein